MKKEQQSLDDILTEEDKKELQSSSLQVEEGKVEDDKVEERQTMW